MSSILYITYDGLLEPLGSSQVLPYVLELASLGFQMEVLSFEKEFPEAEIQKMKERLSARGVIWTPRQYHNRPSLPATIFDIVVGISHALSRARLCRGLIVHARSYLPALMGLPAKKLGARLLFDTRGLWVDERIESGHWSADSLVVKLARMAEKACVREADYFVHLTSKTQDGLAKNVPGVQLAPFEVIPTCADLARFTPPKDLREARSKVGLPDRPTLVHSGTISGWYLSDLTFQVGAEFVNRTGGTFLVLTREEELARELSVKHGVEAVVRSVPPSEMGDWLQACDAGIALVRPSFAKTASCPTKVGEYLGAGLAVGVTSRVGDLDVQLGDSDVAVVVSAEESAETIVSKLLSAIATPERATEARRISLDIWDLNRGVAKYSGIYTSLGQFT